MDFLQLVKEKYGFDEVRWDEKQLLETNHGIKVVNFWKDEALLDWHKRWRDFCSQPPLVLTNRMLRTIDGSAEVAFEDGWFTLHDDITTLAPRENAEQQWAILFSRMLEFGIHECSVNLPYIEKQIPAIEQDERLILESKSLTRKQKNILLACMKEGNIRIKKGNQHIAEVEELPLLDRFESMDQGKAIFQMLYWSGTKKPPEKGFASLVDFLQQWYIENGEASVIQLLDRIDQTSRLKEKWGKVLIGEAFLPWEYIEFMDKLKFEIRDGEELDDLFDQFIKQWDARRQFVVLLGEWINGNREKVAT